MGLRAGDRTAQDGAMGEVVKERAYCTLNCGNCFRSPGLAAEARFFTCTGCGSPAYECERCVRVAGERGHAPAVTCAGCSLGAEVGVDEELS